MREIKVLGPGCAKCEKLKHNADEAVEQSGVDATVEKITDINTITGFGVMMTPALAVDGGSVAFEDVDFGFSFNVVTNLGGADATSAQGSLRRVIDNANAIAGVQTSRFNIPTSDPNYRPSPLAYTIQPRSPLPQITDPSHRGDAGGGCG